MTPKIAFEKVGHFAASVLAGAKGDFDFNTTTAGWRPNYFRISTETATGTLVAMTFRVDGGSAATALAAAPTAGSGLIFLGQDGTQGGIPPAELRFNEGVSRLSIGNPMAGAITVQVFYAIVKD